MAEGSDSKIIKVDWSRVQANSKRVGIFLKWPITLILIAFILSPNFITFWEHQHIDAQLLLQYISVSRWPLVALILALLLRRHLPDLLSRLQNVKAGGVEAGFAPSGSQPTSTKQVEELGESAESKEPAANASVDATELETALTSAEAKLAFEQIYGAIFGTQLITLKRLLTNLATGLTSEQLSDIYDAYKQSAPDGYENLVKFMQYLIDNILVVYDTNNATYNLTYAGVYFLRYLQERGVYNSYKPH